MPLRNRGAANSVKEESSLAPGAKTEKTESTLKKYRSHFRKFALYFGFEDTDSTLKLPDHILEEAKCGESILSDKNLGNFLRWIGYSPQANGKPHGPSALKQIGGMVNHLLLVHGEPQHNYKNKKTHPAWWKAWDDVRNSTYFNNYVVKKKIKPNPDLELMMPASECKQCANNGSPEKKEVHSERGQKRKRALKQAKLNECPTAITLRNTLKAVQRKSFQQDVVIKKMEKIIQRQSAIINKYGLQMDVKENRLIKSDIGRAVVQGDLIDLKESYDDGNSWSSSSKFSESQSSSSMKSTPPIFLPPTPSISPPATLTSLPRFSFQADSNGCSSGRSVRNASSHVDLNYLWKALQKQQESEETDLSYLWSALQKEQEKLGPEDTDLRYLWEAVQKEQEKHGLEEACTINQFDPLPPPPPPETFSRYEITPSSADQTMEDKHSPELSPPGPPCTCATIPTQRLNRKNPADTDQQASTILNSLLNSSTTLGTSVHVASLTEDMMKTEPTSRKKRRIPTKTPTNESDNIIKQQHTPAPALTPTAIHAKARRPRFDVKPGTSSQRLMRGRTQLRDFSKPSTEWCEEEVISWLKTLPNGRCYVDVFRKKCVNGLVLESLSDGMLDRVFGMNCTDILEFKDAVQKLVKQNERYV